MMLCVLLLGKQLLRIPAFAHHMILNICCLTGTAVPQSKAQMDLALDPRSLPRGLRQDVLTNTLLLLQAWHGAIAARRDAAAALDGLAARALLAACGLPQALPTTLHRGRGASLPPALAGGCAYGLALQLAAFRAWQLHLQAR